MNNQKDKTIQSKIKNQIKVSPKIFPDTNNNSVQTVYFRNGKNFDF